ncbi:unnamed protein product [Didymodactylos carnosus]|uniref:Uncharacterized protein n=1 Tax=Didymodactylos carnosus TaxID=1234261 RepID=A0A814IB38_9BILA|nr:unnamed protein product [Didymodactylos carnosus]CAF1021573.1 unnamed protein product [Didymodactylos carnosus]CAF3695591.1 unnamed protein product [Didymodactylos carnosus]CAF3792989.1 unnamed protein product [Didymodactylos carnosus]
MSDGKKPNINNPAAGIGRSDINPLGGNIKEGGMQLPPVGEDKNRNKNADGSKYDPPGPLAEPNKDHAQMPKFDLTDTPGATGGRNTLGDAPGFGPQHGGLR